MKLNVTLDEQASKRFQEIKEHWGFKSDPNIICMLIAREHGRIERSKRRRVFLLNETYARVEKAAEALNLTIDEYVDSVTEQLLKKTANAPGQSANKHIEEAAEDVLKNAKESVKHEQSV